MKRDGKHSSCGKHCFGEIMKAPRGKGERFNFYIMPSRLGQLSYLHKINFPFKKCFLCSLVLAWSAIVSSRALYQLPQALFRSGH